MNFVVSALSCDVMALSKVVWPTPFYLCMIGDFPAPFCRGIPLAQWVLWLLLLPIKSVSAGHCWEVNKDTKVEWFAQECAGRGEFRHQGPADSRRWDWKTSVVPSDCINHCEMRKSECLCHRWNLWHWCKLVVCSYKGGSPRQFHILMS